ncbi:hypothetical protein [Chryseobacterium sp. M5A1_1a]
MSISEALTGFSVNELQSTGLAKTYYTHILKSLEGATFVEFLTVSKNVFENSIPGDHLRDTIASEIMADPEPNKMAGKVITLS